MRRFWTAGLAAIAVAAADGMPGSAQTAPMRISAKPMHEGRIRPTLFGNFIELLDDLVPGMRAEMLNDRGFEGILPNANWVHATGEPNLCDRPWDENKTWTRDAEAPFNGKQSACLTPSGPDASVTQSGLAVRRGMTYLFSGYLRAEREDPPVEVLLKALLPDGRWMTLASVRLSGAAPAWKKFTAELKSDGTTDRAVFELRTSGKGRVWADQLSLVPADHVDGWRKDVVEAIREMRPAIVRWGGCACDPGGYRWKTGVGERDARVPFPNAFWGRIDPNEAGIDEFCRFCAAVGAEPLICLSFSDGAQSAADLVEYCNGGKETPGGAKRAANGHPEPYKVRYWQLGNELGNADYVNGLPPFCEAMKRADPNVVLMASFPSQAMLDKVGKDIAYIGPHHYTPDFNACAADFTNLTAMIRKTPGCGHIRIGVTEWNTSAGDWGLLRGKFLTLENALFNARYLNLLLRRCDIADIACRSNMTNSLGSGVIETRPSGLLKRPSYYAMKLYAEHAKPVPLDVTGAPEGVDVMACRSEDGKSVCLFAVNTRREPVEMRPGLEEFGAGFAPRRAETVCDTRDARQPDLSNHWTAPDRVRTVPLAVTPAGATLPALSVTAMECGTQ